MRGDSPSASADSPAFAISAATIPARGDRARRGPAPGASARSSRRRRAARVAGSMRVTPASAASVARCRSGRPSRPGAAPRAGRRRRRPARLASSPASRVVARKRWSGPAPGERGAQVRDRGDGVGLRGVGALLEARRVRRVVGKRHDDPQQIHVHFSVGQHRGASLRSPHRPRIGRPYLSWGCGLPMLERLRRGGAASRRDATPSLASTADTW